MRLTHTTALRGFAVFTAGAALFASAMLAGAGVANASGVTSPAQAAALAGAPAQPELNQQNGEHHCWWHHKHGKKSWGDKEHGKKDGDKSWGDKKDGKKDSDKSWDGKKDSDKSWDGKKHDDGDMSSSDSQRSEGSSSDSQRSEGNGDSAQSRREAPGSDCQMPTGSVESGFGGAALSGSQSPATTISLGALSALMLGSGVWTLYRSRRTRVRPAAR